MDTQQGTPRLTRHRDAGLTVAELLIAVLLFGVLIALVGPWMHELPRLAARGQDRTELWSSMQDASGQLAADVPAGTKIEVAEAQKFVIYVVRNEIFERRTYQVNGPAKTLSVTTAWFAQKSCAGPTESRTDVLVRAYTGTATFRYKNELAKAIPVPVEEPRNIRIVSWTLAALPANARTAMDLPGSETFVGRNDAHGSGDDSLEPQAPLLTVATNATAGRREGVSQPVLTWVDSTPTLTTGWTILRALSVDGAATGRVTWTPIATIPDPAATSWTDGTLEAGMTAMYTVQAKTSDPNAQLAPTSNSVVTGLRPAPITDLAAVGAPQTITLTWTAPTGQTGADIYRDGVLVDRVTGQTATYTDGPGKHGWTQNPSQPTLDGYGHAHNYAVVATNRWESAAMAGGQTNRVALDDPISKVHQPTVTAPASGKTRAASNIDGAFTAPAAPAATAVSGTDWAYTVGWAPAAWVGTGPTTLGGIARDRGWVAARNASVTATASGAWTALWAGAENLPTVASRKTQSYGVADGGNYAHFQIRTCNAVGCSPSRTPTAIMRPKAPASCAATPTTTRATSVTVTPAAAQAPNTGSALSGGTPAAGYAVAGTGTSAGFIYGVDQLAHSSSHSFTARVTNAGGASDSVTCGTTTLVLAVSAPSWTSSTRRIDATASATNATASNLTLEGVSTLTGLTGAWDPLTDGTAFTLTARASDGVNHVVAQAGASTKVLAAPGAPVCSVSVGDSIAPGSVTISGGSQARLGSSGTAYGSPRTFGPLSQGTYTGYARNVASDGHNTAYSGWDACAGATINSPPPSGATGISVGGHTPDLGYIAFSTSDAADSFTYQMRWLNSDLGSIREFPAVTLSVGSSSVQIAGTKVMLLVEVPYTGQDTAWSSFEARIIVKNASGASGWSAWG